MDERNDRDKLSLFVLDIMERSRLIDLREQVFGLAPRFAGLSEPQAERLLVELYGDRP
ncbi:MULTISPECIES: hypothetical protein [unclassified Bradyrhizobium]